MDRLGRDQRDAVVQRLGPHPALKRLLGGGQFGAGVDAQRLGLVAAHHADAVALLSGNGDNVGQVEFPCRILAADRVDKFEKCKSVGADDARITQRDGAFRRGRILEFDDPFQAVALHHQPPVAPGVGCLEPQHDDRVARAGLEHRLQRLGADKGGVAV